MLWGPAPVNTTPVSRVISAAKLSELRTCTRLLRRRTEAGVRRAEGGRRAEDGGRRQQDGDRTCDQTPGTR